MIEEAEKNYEELASNKIFLTDECRNYHLSTWKSFLLSI
jgi:hypothetical protein